MGALDRFEWERLIRELDLPGAVKATAYTLATYVNADGTRGHPGLDRLSRGAGFHRATVVRALAALEAGGLLARQAHGGGRGLKLAAEYTLAVGEAGYTTADETVRTVRTVFGRKTSPSASKDFALCTKQFAQGDPTKPVPPLSPSLTNGSVVDGPVEGEGCGERKPVFNTRTRAGTQQAAMAAAAALTAWQASQPPGGEHRV